MAGRSNALPSANRWDGHLLCRRYDVVYLNQLDILLPDGCAAQARVVVWALGLTGRSEFELFGVWPGTAFSPWGLALDDIRIRGVERVRAVVVDDGASRSEVRPPRLAGAVVLPSFGRLLDRSFSEVSCPHREAFEVQLVNAAEADSESGARTAVEAVAQSLCCEGTPSLIAEWQSALERGRHLWSLPPTLRREVLAGDGTAALASRSLRRSIARHGPFADEESAISFVSDRLESFLDRRRREPGGAVTEPNHHRDGFSPTMAVLGV